MTRRRIGHVMDRLLDEAARRGGTFVLADWTYDVRFQQRNWWRSARLLAAIGCARLTDGSRPAWKRKFIVFAITEHGLATQSDRRLRVREQSNARRREVG